MKDLILKNFSLSDSDDFTDLIPLMSTDDEKRLNSLQNQIKTSTAEIKTYDNSNTFWKNGHLIYPIKYYELPSNKKELFKYL